MTDVFEKYDLSDVDESFPIPLIREEGVTLIVGTSGSGKGTILKKALLTSNPIFDKDTPIIDNFSSPENGERFLIAAGLRTIPAWKRPISQLSNGERHRAEIAMLMDQGVWVFDEFTSVVDRDTARSLCVGMMKAYKRFSIKRAVFASCHRDIIPWLQPDFVYDSDVKKYAVRGCLCRPKLRISVSPCDTKEVWEIFRRHHYLSSKINPAASSWVATVNGSPLAFTSVLAFPSGSLKNAYREHRTVVLPEFQGMGLGNELSETVANHIVSEGYRYFSKTAHPAMGEHRNKSSLWRPTSKNAKARKDYRAEISSKDCLDKMRHSVRTCYSHEYLGDPLL